ncbi:D-alanyl-D-alanine carboxypeptidase/D-alanyl-D-alanine endopeptidase [Vibrio agarilyticus]|nr:D-alanyl-D-alanine carboxypeptidase/D-alanyl-D-alanine-endopeptidase [Vibrio agarilyticus]
MADRYHAIEPLANRDTRQNSQKKNTLKSTGSHQTLSVLDNTHTQLYPPASTLKILTALAAKAKLGDEFRYTTALSASDSDWVLRFSGDPTLTREDLNRLLVTAKRLGHRKINGDLWLDDSAFSGYDRAVGWPWDGLGVCYSAPASAISLDGNCAHAALYSQKNGQTRVNLPAHYPLKVITTTQTVSEKEQKARHCGLELHSDNTNRYHLSGCMTSRDKPLPLKFAIQNSALYTKAVLKTLLKANGIVLNGSIRIGQPSTNTARQTIARHHSNPLPSLLKVMLQESNNLIADNLTKSLGAAVYQTSGSFANGTAAIIEVLAQLGISLEGAQLVDGSGLSRNNRLSPQQMFAVLHYIANHDAQLQLITLLPSSGLDGTLKYRPSMRAEDITGRIKAKSGSLYGSYNMAGFGLNETGTPHTAFVHFVRDFFPDKTLGQGYQMQDLTNIEQHFFRQVIKQSQ